MLLNFRKLPFVLGNPVGEDTSFSCSHTCCCHSSVKEEEAGSDVAGPSLPDSLPVNEEAEAGSNVAGPSQPDSLPVKEEAVDPGFTVPPSTPELFGDLPVGDDGEH